MGHSEMLLAVAGLKEDEIKERVKKIGSGNWSLFTQAERHAFEFAYKLTRAPASVTAEDVQALVKTFGPERALDSIYYVSWCNYMTRVADGVQFPLEKENVFAPKK